MNVRALTKILIAVVLTLSFINCDDGDNGSDVPITDNEEKALLGTSWKLVGIVGENETLREFEPTDCERCYTLFFDSVATPCISPLPTSLCPDMTFSGYSHVNRVCGTYCINYETRELSFANYISTLVGSIYVDEELWHNILNATVSFVLQDNKLKLYSSENEFMLFEPYNEN